MNCWALLSTKILLLLFLKKAPLKKKKRNFQKKKKKKKESSMPNVEPSVGLEPITLRSRPELKESAA